MLLVLQGSSSEGETQLGFAYSLCKLGFLSISEDWQSFCALAMNGKICVVNYLPQ
jgi:hypothetical protein